MEEEAEEGPGDGLENEYRYQWRKSKLGRGHRWELPGNYPLFTVVMVIYHYVERIRRILVTP